VPEQPKLLKIVSDMRAEGLSDKEIIDNLRQIGLKDDQIKQVMQVASKDIYSQFKREMHDFVGKRIGQSKDLIGKMVGESVEQKLTSLKDDLKNVTEAKVGEFAKVVNEKTDDMTLAVKRVREENLKIMEQSKLNRTDIDVLLAGPSKVRLIISIIFLVLSVLTLGYAIFFVTPQVVALDFSEAMDGVILLVTGAVYVLAAIAFATVGIYFSGKPGRQ